MVRNLSSRCPASFPVIVMLCIFLHLDPYRQDPARVGLIDTYGEVLIGKTLNKHVDVNLGLGLYLYGYDHSCVYGKYDEKYILEQNRLTTESFPLVESRILNGESFIIINKKLFILICKKNEPENNKIEYKIRSRNPGFIQINPNNNKKIIRFKNNKTNIIDKSTVLAKKNNDGVNNNRNNIFSKINSMNKDNWLIIYGDVINYFNFENYISNNLNNEKSEPIKFRGFLVNNDWVDNWKKNSFYEEIKENIILKNIKNDNFISNFIMTKQLETKSNYDGILDIKNYIIPDNQIEEALKTEKSYALLNENFVSQFMNIISIKLFKYILNM